MIPLKPIPNVGRHQCPYCQIDLTVSGWVITGMRNLAEVFCARCKREFYEDLPSGQGFYTPILLDKLTGKTYDETNTEWFSKWLSDSYAQRKSEPIEFEIKSFSEVKNKVVLLNCLDTLYGHSLLKLLNAQRYLNLKDVSLIVLIPTFLEWMLPAGIAEAWVVDFPLKRGTQWNDWLSAKIKNNLASFAEVFLSIGFSHPHSTDFDIQKFTKIAPFPHENWADSLDKPCVTFIWRDDRLWINDERLNPFDKLKRKFLREQETENQLQQVKTLAETLRTDVPGLDFAVVGMGEARGLPEWISDLRLRKIDAATEIDWCKRYAQSHIIIGVHGSNMLLPSAHAGGFIELLGENRWGNFLQDILFRQLDSREMFFLNRFVQLSIKPPELSQLVVAMLRYDEFKRLMSPKFYKLREKV